MRKDRKRKGRKRKGPVTDRAFAGLAEREGFEPSIRFTVYTLSRRAPSTARPSLRVPPAGDPRTGSAPGHGGREPTATRPAAIPTANRARPPAPRAPFQPDPLPRASPSLGHPDGPGPPRAGRSVDCRRDRSSAGRGAGRSMPSDGSPTSTRLALAPPCRSARFRFASLRDVPRRTKSLASGPEPSQRLRRSSMRSTRRMDPAKGSRVSGATLPRPPRRPRLHPALTNVRSTSDDDASKTRGKPAALGRSVDPSTRRLVDSPLHRFDHSSLHRIRDRSIRRSVPLNAMHRRMHDSSLARRRCMSSPRWISCRRPISRLRSLSRLQSLSAAQSDASCS